MDDFFPRNKLEEMLLHSQHDSNSVGEFVQQLWISDLALPTHNEVHNDGAGFLPIIFDKLGVSMVAAFTSKERMRHLQHLAKYCLVMTGGEVLRRMPAEYGLVVNPGIAIGFELSPSGISAIVKKFG